MASLSTAQKVTKAQRDVHREITRDSVQKAEGLITSASVDAESFTENEHNIAGSLAVVKAKIELLQQLDLALLEDATEDFDVRAEMLDVELYTTDYETRYAVVKSKFTKLQTLHAQQRYPNHDRSRDEVSNRSSQSKAYKLPKVSLKHFDGQQVNWIPFIEDFNAAVTQNETLEMVTKLRYLKSCLSGAPLMAIDGLPLVGESFHAAILVLRERYGGIDVNVEAHVNALCIIEPPSDSPGSLLTFFDTVQNHLRSLEYLGKTNLQLTDLCVPLVRRKLPRTVRVQMRRARDESRTWDIQKFMSNLFREIKALCDGDFSASPTNYSSNLNTPTASFFTGSNNRRPSPSPRRGPARSSCPYCKIDGHRASECNSVRDHNERIDLLIRDKLCINCTGPHNRTDCRSSRSCLHCQGRHHTSVHEGFTAQASSGDQKHVAQPQLSETRRPSPSPQHQPAGGRRRSPTPPTHNRTPGPAQATVTLAQMSNNQPTPTEQ